jgi:sterol desaturase/sphingolipid hydroxylase (fatty acid hydroxylase superfamily)
MIEYSMSWSESIVNHEPVIRAFVFLGVLGALAATERVVPRRKAPAFDKQRWKTNLGVLLIDILLVRILLPAGAVGIAVLAEAREAGLLHHIEWPLHFKVLVAFLALDLAIYLQHVIFHAVPLLWRLHRVHHADVHLDVTTGVRFHPIEILLSLLIKSAAIFLIGPPVIAVLLFEIALNATSMFSHSNLRLPRAVDALVRCVLVTADMHRVHHSIEAAETNSNFGFNLPWWDRLFGTYRAQPAAGHERMTIGIPQFRSMDDLRLDRVLAQPFRNPDADTQHRLQL